MLFSRIQLNDGAVVNVAALLMFETYEFNLKTRKPSGERNRMIASSIELSIKRMLPQYPIVTLIDNKFFNEDTYPLPDVVVAVLLRTELSQNDLSSLLVACVQDNPTLGIDEPNLKRIHALPWSKLAKQYHI